MTTNNLHSKPLHHDMFKASLFSRMEKTVDMLFKISSIERILPYKDDKNAVERCILSIENLVFSKLSSSYGTLSRYLMNENRPDDAYLLTLMEKSPQFLHPTYDTQNDQKDEIIPHEIMSGNVLNAPLIPFLLHVCNSHNYYQFCECGGLLRSYGNTYTTPRAPSNLLLDVIEHDFHDTVSEVFEMFCLDRRTMAASNSLSTLYHPEHIKPFEYMVHRDPTILWRSIENKHPLKFLYEEWLNVPPWEPAEDHLGWFKFICAYFKLSIQFFPRECGFLFLYASPDKNPIFVDILLHENELVRDRKLVDMVGLETIYEIYKSVSDPTNLFHNMLLFASILFTDSINNIQTKGKYYSTGRKPMSLLECFIGRKRLKVNEDSELEVLYTIIRNWPHETTLML